MTYLPSVFQRVGDGGHDTELLDVGGVLVAVFDFKLSLASRLNLAQLRLAGLCELLGRLVRS